MTATTYPLVDSIDFHVNKMVSKDHISGPKNHVLLPFPYDDEDLPTDAAVSATKITTTN